MNKSILITVIVLAVILLGGFLYFSNKNTSSNNDYTSPPSGNSNPVDSGETTDSGSGLSPTTHYIDIKNFAFQPSSLTINNGDTVVWTNMDSSLHDVKSDSGSELSSNSLSKGNSYSHKFTLSGTFAYHCSFHPGMKATIIVQ